MTNAAGVFFYSSSTNRYLYLLRSDKNNTTWSIPGGKVEKGETLLEGIERECVEEMSFFDPEMKLIPIQKFTNGNFVYNTFFCQVKEEFIPVLNDEHFLDILLVIFLTVDFQLAQDFCH